MKLPLEDKINRIIETCDTDLAIEKIQGSLKQFYWNQSLLNCLGDLHHKKGDNIKAGQYWFFKEEKSEIEKMAVLEFQGAYGNDLKHIARKLIGHNFNSPKKLSHNTKYELFKILETICQADGEVPDFAKNWYGHLLAIFSADI